MLNETKVTVDDSVYAHHINNRDEIIKLAEDYSRDLITTASYLIAAEVLINHSPINFYEGDNGTVIDYLADGIRWIEDQCWIIDQYNKLYPEGSLS